MPSIFVSYSSSDSETAEFIATALRRAGFGVWVDFENIRGGADWLCEIQAGIARCDALVVLLSSASAQSVWVERECLYAFQLQKPVFTALLEDVLLPLHLINIQYSDCRARLPAGTAELTRALQTALPAERANYAPETVSSQPSPANFFPYIQQLPQGETALLIARSLYDWALQIADEIDFGGKVNPVYHVRVDVGKARRRAITVFSIWAYPKTPSTQVPLDTLASQPPYSDPQQHRALLESINALLPFDATASRRPTFPLHLLSDAKKRAAYQQLLLEIIQNLRRHQPTG